ncbi:MAG: hypothetical protein MI919_16610 [Holophagales bacterium]|nr:hypothetical protein [Holophagales bacterium]
MAGEHGNPVTVLRQDGDRVEVAVPLVGFPPGFRIPPGSRVVLTTGPDGPAARPLVTAIEVESGAELEGEAFEVQANTIRAEGAEDSGRRIVWFLDGGDTEGPRHVVAHRPVNR